MNRPRICAVVINQDLAAIKEVEKDADLFEVRIDLVGEGWQKVARQLDKPWIACNRSNQEGGRWQGTEPGRIDELVKAVELGASIIDIELASKNLEEIVSTVKKKAKCLLSHHDLKTTPPLDALKEIMRRQLAAGADICKVVTTAQQFEDNMSVLQLIAESPKTKIVSFTMGDKGIVSRVMSPLMGGDFTYASIEKGLESAPGQITVKELRKLYGMIKL